MHGPAAVRGALLNLWRTRMQTPINTFKQAMAAGDVKLGLWLALDDGYAA